MKLEYWKQSPVAGLPFMASKLYPKQLSHLLGYLMETITITFSYFYNVLYIAWGRAIGPKVVSSIPDGVTGIFLWLVPTKFLTEMRTRNNPWTVKEYGA